MRATAALVVLLATLGAARAADFVLEDVAIPAGATIYRAKRIEVFGAPATREDAQKALAASGADLDPLAKIDAERVLIPELTSQTTAGDYAQTIVYRDLRLTGLRQGRARAVDAAGARIETKRVGEASSGAFGALHAEDVDFPAAAQLLNARRKNADEPKRQAVALLSAADLELVGPQGGKVSVAKVLARAISGRALAAPLTGLFDLAPKQKTPAAPADSRAASAMAADIAGSVEIGAAELDGIVFSDADKPSEAGRIKRVAFRDIAAARIGEVAIEGLDGGPRLSGFALGRARLVGLDFAQAIAGAAARPRFDRLEAEGIEAAAPGRPIRIERFTADARDWGEAAPAAFDASWEHAVVSLASFGLIRTPTLAALGYDALDLSGALRLRYDGGRSELSVSEFSLRSPPLGALRFAVTLGDAGPGVLSAAAERWRGAIDKLTFARASLTLADAGLVGRALAAQAKERDMPEDKVRAELAAQAQALQRVLFSAAPPADPRLAALDSALAGFLAGGKTLEIAMEAKGALAGGDFIRAATFGTLLDRVALDARLR